MPGLDRTGPLGNGALSGRRGENCGSGIPLRRAFYGDGPIRRGSGMGGFGRGYRWQYIETGLPRWVSTPAMDPPLQTEDKAALKTALELEVKALKEQLNDVKAYLESLKLETRNESEEVNLDTTLERSE